MADIKKPEGKPKPEMDAKVTRRRFLRDCARGAGLVGLGGVTGLVAGRADADKTVWQIDPHKCVSCGNCATNCVLDVSAVKCFHAYAVCGYCQLCSAFFETGANELNSGAENQLCPVGAIARTYVEDPYYEYVIDESICLGCGKCVKGCNAFGNGSLFLQVRQDLCVGCNDCSIAAACPSGAIARVSAKEPYILVDADLT